MNSFNEVILTGRFTSDPELKASQSGVKVLNFSLAVQKNFTKSREAIFVNLTAFKENADFISRFFQKGSMIGIRGHLDVNSWTDKNGNKRNDLVVIVDDWTFCGSKNDNAEQKTQQAQAQYKQPVDFEEVAGNDLPF